jgi:hypothetical protein
MAFTPVLILLFLLDKFLSASVNFSPHSRQNNVIWRASNGNYSTVTEQPFAINNSAKTAVEFYI